MSEVVQLFEPALILDQDNFSFSQPSYSYLANSPREEAARVRQLLQDWFAFYPVDRQADLKSRICSSQDNQHRAAVFELYLFSILRELGYSIEVGPILGNQRPDFLAQGPDGSRFVLEATSVNEASDGETAADQRRSKVLDQLYRLRSSRIILDVAYDGTPERDTSIQRELNLIQIWLDSLDYNYIKGLYSDKKYSELPSYTFNVHSLQIELKAYPDQQHSPVSTSKHIIACIGPREAIWSRTSEAIRHKIKQKMQHYDKVDMPFVLAMNCANMGVDGHHVVSALLGDLAFAVDVGSNGKRVLSIVRLQNGLLNHRRQPRWTRLSALIVIGELDAWSLAARPLVLYENPCAARKLDGAITAIRRVSIAEDGTLVPHGGNEAREILRLWEGWPCARSSGARTAG